MIRSQQTPDKAGKIKPLVRSALQQPVVKVIAVNIDIRPLHCSPSDTARAPTFRSELRYRLGRTWRVDANIMAYFQPERNSPAPKSGTATWRFSLERRSPCDTRILAKCRVSTTPALWYNIFLRGLRHNGISPRSHLSRGEHPYVQTLT